MNIQELKNLHQICEPERTELLIILPLCVRIFNSLVTFYLETAETLSIKKALLLGYMIFLNFFHLCVELRKVLIAYQNTIETL